MIEQHVFHNIVNDFIENSKDECIVVPPGGYMLIKKNVHKNIEHTLIKHNIEDEILYKILLHIYNVVYTNNQKIDKEHIYNIYIKEINNIS